MLHREIKIGHLLRFSYLWHWQNRVGREDGDKIRPCLVLALVETSERGKHTVRVLPVTHTPPLDPEHAVEIPRAVKLRLQLDNERSWIVLTESNRFVWPGQDLRSPPQQSADGYLGMLPPDLFNKVKQGFVALARSARHKSVFRSE